MTVRQILLKTFYPLLMKFNKSKAGIYTNDSLLPPHQSFYNLTVKLNSGEVLPFGALRNKKVLIVNTASDCGYTAQYAALQQLYEQYQNFLTLIAFPANDFGLQEKGTDKAIAAFCKTNYGVSFPIAQKSVVLKTAEQNVVFRWLTNKQVNGWNDQPPKWNFTKYLINENGILTHIFDTAISPLSQEIIAAIKK